MTRKIKKTLGSALLMTAIAVFAPLYVAAEEKAAEPAKPVIKDCDMTFTLKGWSAIYKTAKGEGNITCTNGQTAKVKIKITGGGLTFGKTEIFNGKGEISGVKSIDDIFGSYASAEAHAGVVKSVSGTVMTKGNVSLALSGTGSGVDIGIDFSKFKIEKM